MDAISHLSKERRSMEHPPEGLTDFEGIQIIDPEGFPDGPICLDENLEPYIPWTDERGIDHFLIPEFISINRIEKEQWIVKTLWNQYIQLIKTENLGKPNNHGQYSSKTLSTSLDLARYWYYIGDNQSCFEHCKSALKILEGRVGDDTSDFYSSFSSLMHVCEREL